MAQWSRIDRTLYAKLVYYGPALGGKATNLRALHRLTDPEGRERLVSVGTADERTLFFDLLPFEIVHVFGYKVAIKVYTVPGQARYDATRRIVLAGADAVVFVADSTPGREQDNRHSWDDLRMNMRANRLDPGAIPILVQLNKRDVPGAVDAVALGTMLAPAAAPPLEAVATEGEGVLETLVAAAHAMLARLIAFAEPQARRRLPVEDLATQIDRAFAPHLARRRASRGPDASTDRSERLMVAPPDLCEGAAAAHRDDLEETVRERTQALREAYDELKAAAAMKDRFLSGMSHEMRTPLTAIVGAATFLRDYDGTRADREEMAVTVLAAADELLGKVEALLRVAQLRDEEGAAARVEPEALVAEAVRLAGEPVGVRVAIPPGLPPLTGDPARLARAIANLVDNARKFGPVDEEVEVRLAPAVGTLLVSVLDRGPGLAGEDVDRAFEAFEQGGDPLTGKPHGVGLGLYEARAIARRHGGSLVYLRRDGGGSEFRLSLPTTVGEREVSRA